MNRFRHSQQHDALRKMLIALRQKQNLTQKSLAERLKKPQSYVSKYEIGEKNIDVIEFIHITKALNSDPALTINNLLEFIHCN